MASSYRVSKLDICRIRDDGFVIRLELGTVTTLTKKVRTTKELKEESLELPAKNYVDYKVDTAVDRH